MTKPIQWKSLTVHRPKNSDSQPKPEDKPLFEVRNRRREILMEARRTLAKPRAPEIRKGPQGKLHEPPKILDNDVDDDKKCSENSHPVLVEPDDTEVTTSFTPFDEDENHGQQDQGQADSDNDSEAQSSEETTVMGELIEPARSTNGDSPHARLAQTNGVKAPGVHYGQLVVEYLVSTITDFCNDAAVNNGGAWNISVDFDPTILPSTSLQLNLASAHLMLQFRSNNTDSVNIIEQNQGLLIESLEANLTPLREVSIGIN